MIHYSSTKTKIILVFVITLALFLRTYKLASVPPHLTVDEASLGYNAYSILKTTRDEYGQFLPLVFKSFGDYKPGLYTYATVPFIATLGLTEFAVRLPSALAGVAAVYLVYLLTKILFNRHTTNSLSITCRPESNNKNSKIAGRRIPYETPTRPLNTTALLATLFLAINPWHLHFSRGAWEANLSLTLTLAGIYFFLKAIHSPPVTNKPQTSQSSSKFPTPNPYYLLSALTLGLTLYTYQSAKLFTPLIILGLIIFFGKNTWQRFKLYSLIYPIILIILFSPIVIGLLNDTSGRLKVFSAFSYTRPPEEIQTLVLDQDHITQDSLTFRLFHSEAYNHLRTLLGHYFNYFSGRFLLFEGDWTHPAHHAPYYGYLYWLDLLALFASLYLITNPKKTSLSPKNFPTTYNLQPTTSFYFLLYWLAISPLPAVLSRDQVHAIRSLNMIIPLVILIALGWTTIIQKITKFKRTLKILLMCSMVCVMCFNFIYYLDLYYTHFPIAASQDFQYGYKQLALATQPYIQNHQPVVISQSYAQPYIFFLFYLRYPPEKYQAQARLSASPTSAYGDVGFVNQLDNITFRPINWSVDQYAKGTVFAADPVTTIHPEESSDPTRFKPIADINYLNGTPAFRVVEVL